MAQEAEKPKIHIDSDWKAQARAEKEQLTRASETKAPKAAAGEEELEGAGGAGAGGGYEVPPASFQTLLSSMISQALMYMGGIADPQTGRAMVHLDAARHTIDLLAVLEEKTKGNLTEEEGKLLTQALHELRFSFLQIRKQVEEQIRKQGEAKGKK